MSVFGRLAVVQLVTLSDVLRFLHNRTVQTPRIFLQSHLADDGMNVLLIALVQDRIDLPTNLPVQDPHLVEDPHLLVVVALGSKESPDLVLVPRGHDTCHPLEIEATSQEREIIAPHH